MQHLGAICIVFEGKNWSAMIISQSLIPVVLKLFQWLYNFNFLANFGIDIHLLLF